LQNWFLKLFFVLCRINKGKKLEMLKQSSSFKFQEKLASKT
jgi:hypothetical protein